MDYSVFVVMTLLSVHMCVALQKENLTLARVNETTTLLQGSTTESVDRNSTASDEVQEGNITKQYSTTEAVPITGMNGETTQGLIDKDGSAMKASDTTTVQSVTENSVDVTTSETTTQSETLTNNTNIPDAKTTQFPRTSSKSTNIADKTTHSLPRGDVLNTLISTEKIMNEAVENTTATNSETQTDSPYAILPAEETTTRTPPEQFFKSLDSIPPDTTKNTSQTEIGGRNNETKEYVRTADVENGNNVVEDFGSSISDQFDLDKTPSRDFMEWLDSIHPDTNKAKNIIDTSIISAEKLIIVISTICGSFVLFVVILIAISCCRRKRNMRNDSEKSDFSVTSVISVPDKRKSDSFSTCSTDKNGFNNLFMGIPTNNEVWKNLEQLSAADSSVMPESTKM